MPFEGAADQGGHQVTTNWEAGEKNVFLLKRLTHCKGLHASEKAVVANEDPQSKTPVDIEETCGIKLKGYLMQLYREKPQSHKKISTSTQKVKSACENEDTS